MKTLRWSSPPDNVRARFLQAFQDKPYLVWLDSHSDLTDPYGVYDFIGAWGDESVDPCQSRNQWVFGGMSYDYLQVCEPIPVTLKPPRIALPPVFFFQAKGVILKRKDHAEVQVIADAPDKVQQDIINIFSIDSPGLSLTTEITSGITEDAYIEKVEALKHLIREGWVYEANLSRCLHFEGVCQSPVALLASWMDNSPVPFSGFIKWENVYGYCGSPERFLAHRNGLMISQPIKGTSPRYPDNLQADEASAQSLKASAKNQAENVMIVDLVRNDLNRSCISGTVEVPELFGLHAFPWVYHLISTVTGKLRPDFTAWKGLRQAFPPGSMTGAPKVSAMKIIHDLEPEGRGLFAGSLGYIEPTGNFDFNVVIRTLMYDAATGRFSYHAGGAVTIDSDAKEEYEETVVKSRNLLRWLESETQT